MEYVIEEKFNPKTYLETYYTEVDSENAALLEFWSKMPVHGHETVLEVGAGPTVFTAVPFATRVRQIILTDALEENLNEILAWVMGTPDAFDWSNTIEYYCKIVSPGARYSDSATVLKTRLQQIISTYVLDINLPKKSALLRSEHKCDIVLASFCLEAASKDKDHYKTLFHNLTELVKPDGSLGVITALDTGLYCCGYDMIPMLSLQKYEVLDEFMRNGYNDLHIQVIPISVDRGYKEILAVWGKRH